MFGNYCLFCGGDSSEPDHWERCDGRQGEIEATIVEPDPTITTTTITTPRETSVLAFYTAVDSGAIRTRQQLVWRALNQLGAATANEVAEYLKEQRQIAPDMRCDTNTCARMTELRDRGLIREVGTRPCRVTNQVCITWAIVPSGEHAGVAVVHRCPLCHHIVSREIPSFGGGL